jgi:hypothetical protein
LGFKGLKSSKTTILETLKKNSDTPKQKKQKTKKLETLKS